MTGEFKSSTKSSIEISRAFSQSKIRVNSILRSPVNVRPTCDLDTPRIDLPPAVYSMPDSLDGRDLVQVSVKWPMIAKEDLYSLDRILHDLPSKPSVINLEFSKGDQVNYIESNYVLEADGGGGYIFKNSRFVKQSFEFPDVETKSTLGKSLLIKGSDEHMAAAKEAASIKQAADDKKRIAKAEAETKSRIAKAESEAERLAEVKLKVDQLLKVLEKKGVFEGALTAKNSGNGSKENSQFELTCKSVENRSGDTFVIVELLQHYVSWGNRRSTTASFKGKFDKEGTLSLLNVSPGNNGWDFIDNSNAGMSLHYADHIDKIRITASTGKWKIDGDLVRK